MSRSESKFTAAEAAELDAAEIVAAFQAQLANSRCNRNVEIARLLAAGPGWKEARDQLSGAFAEASAEEGLKDDKGS